MDEDLLQEIISTTGFTKYHKNNHVQNSIRSRINIWGPDSSNESINNLRLPKNVPNLVDDSYKEKFEFRPKSSHHVGRGRAHKINASTSNSVSPVGGLADYMAPKDSSSVADSLKAAYDSSWLNCSASNHVGNHYEDTRRSELKNSKGNSNASNDYKEGNLINLTMPKDSSSVAENLKLANEASFHVNSVSNLVDDYYEDVGKSPHKFRNDNSLRKAPNGYKEDSPTFSDVDFPPLGAQNHSELVYLRNSRQECRNVSSMNVKRTINDHDNKIGCSGRPRICKKAVRNVIMHYRTNRPKDKCDRAPMSEHDVIESSNVKSPPQYSNGSYSSDDSSSDDDNCFVEEEYFETVQPEEFPYHEQCEQLSEQLADTEISSGDDAVPSSLLVDSDTDVTNLIKLRIENLPLSLDQDYLFDYLVSFGVVEKLTLSQIGNFKAAFLEIRTEDIETLVKCITCDGPSLFQYPDDDPPPEITCHIVR